MAVVLWAAAVILLAVSTAIGQEQPALWLRVVALVAQSAGALCLGAALVFSIRKPLIRWVRAALLDMAGPALIRSMPPRTVLAALLPRMYGDSSTHQGVITGILGGAGRDGSGGDTAVSSRTLVDVKIDAVSETECMTYVTTRHEYSGITNNHLLMIFATSDQEFAEIVASERVFPLYELWKMDEDSLEEFVPSLSENLRIGIDYTDDDGVTHKVEPRPYVGEEVAFRHYDSYLRIPERLDRKNLRIIQVDLHDLADDDHVVTSIQTVVTTSSNVASTDLGYVIWHPPHPSFVQAVTFDLTGLHRPGDGLVYLVMLGVLNRAGAPFTKWRPVEGPIEIPVRSWMLPGHTVTLMYRPASTAELRHAPEPD